MTCCNKRAGDFSPMPTLCAAFVYSTWLHQFLIHLSKGEKERVYQSESPSRKISYTTLLARERK